MAEENKMECSPKSTTVYRRPTGYPKSQYRKSSHNSLKPPANPRRSSTEILRGSRSSLRRSSYNQDGLEQPQDEDPRQSNPYRYSEMSRDSTPPPIPKKPSRRSSTPFPRESKRQDLDTSYDVGENRKSRCSERKKKGMEYQNSYSSLIDWEERLERQKHIDNYAKKCRCATIDDYEEIKENQIKDIRYFPSIDWERKNQRQQSIKNSCDKSSRRSTNGRRESSQKECTKLEPKQMIVYPRSNGEDLRQSKRHFMQYDSESDDDNVSPRNKKGKPERYESSERDKSSESSESLPKKETKSKRPTKPNRPSTDKKTRKGMKEEPSKKPKKSDSASKVKQKKKGAVVGEREACQLQRNSRKPQRKSCPCELKGGYEKSFTNDCDACSKPFNACNLYNSDFSVESLRPSREQLGKHITPAPARRDDQKNFKEHMVSRRKVAIDPNAQTLKSKTPKTRSAPTDRRGDKTLKAHRTKHDDEFELYLSKLRDRQAKAEANKNATQSGKGHCRCSVDQKKSKKSMRKTAIPVNKKVNRGLRKPNSEDSIKSDSYETSKSCNSSLSSVNDKPSKRDKKEMKIVSSKTARKQPKADATKGKSEQKEMEKEKAKNKSFRCKSLFFCHRKPSTTSIDDGSLTSKRRSFDTTSHSSESNSSLSDDENSGRRRSEKSAPSKGERSNRKSATTANRQSPSRIERTTKRPNQISGRSVTWTGLQYSSVSRFSPAKCSTPEKPSIVNRTSTDNRESYKPKSKSKIETSSPKTQKRLGEPRAYHSIHYVNDSRHHHCGNEVRPSRKSKSPKLRRAAGRSTASSKQPSPQTQKPRNGAKTFRVPSHTLYQMISIPQLDPPPRICKKTLYETPRESRASSQSERKSSMTPTPTPRVTIRDDRNTIYSSDEDTRTTTQSLIRPSRQSTKSFGRPSMAENEFIASKPNTGRGSVWSNQSADILSHGSRASINRISEDRNTMYSSEYDTRTTTQSLIRPSRQSTKSFGRPSMTENEFIASKPNTGRGSVWSGQSADTLSHGSRASINRISEEYFSAQGTSNYNQPPSKYSTEHESISLQPIAIRASQRVTIANDDSIDKRRSTALTQIEPRSTKSSLSLNSFRQSISAESVRSSLSRNSSIASNELEQSCGTIHDDANRKPSILYYPLAAGFLHRKSSKNTAARCGKRNRKPTDYRKLHIFAHGYMSEESRRPDMSYLPPINDQRPTRMTLRNVSTTEIDDDNKTVMEKPKLKVKKKPKLYLPRKPVIAKPAISIAKKENNKYLVGIKKESKPSVTPYGPDYVLGGKMEAKDSKCNQQR